MSWQEHAARLAAKVAGRGSRWHKPVASVPRHVFVPRWWDNAGTDGWTLREGQADVSAWHDAAYADQTLVTQVGALHADNATPGDRPDGQPTSSATLPGLVVQMYRHASIAPGGDVLDVGTGSGYGCALLANRFGVRHVTSIDVDQYLTGAAARRLASIGLRPQIVSCDATGELPGTYDRIVSMVSMPTVPASWLAALRTGGRLVTVIAGTTLILVADKKADGSAEGRITWDRAGFMRARGAAGYPPPLLDQMTGRMVHDQDAEKSQGRYPVLDVEEAWDLASMLELHAPGVEHHYQEDPDGTRTAWILHADGSWACATAHGSAAPAVRQAGPRRLWDILDEIRDYWLIHGELPVRGARVFIPARGGKVYLARGEWEAVISPGPR